MSSRTHRNRPHRSQSSSSSNYSDSSDHSRSTAPTIYSVRPPLKHFNTAGARLDGYAEEYTYDYDQQDARASTETYASTVPSLDDLPEEPQYEVPVHRHEVFATDAIPSTPPEFAALFPSSRRLLIRHDDATVDGNMNLRVDTKLSASGGRTRDVILFHLRMHDLKNRRFSLRRYCRESGREVCHSSRKYTQTAVDKRPGFQRSLSNALSTLRIRSESTMPTLSSLKRRDSGYDSMGDDDEDFELPKSHATSRMSTNMPIPTNTTQLEFSNYAHVEVKRRGAKSSKRYCYSYWGKDYQWRREVRKDGDFKEVSYHLVDAVTSKSIANIFPEPMTRTEAAEEDAKGGWVPPCSMWIQDPTVFSGLTDVADVIVATGLIALVDDCVKRRWHSKRSVQLTLPMKSSLKKNKEYVRPKRLIDEVFNRRGPTDTHRSTPSRQISARS